MGKLEELREKIYSKAFPGRKRVVRIPLEQEMKSEKPIWTQSEEEQKAEERKRRRHKAISVIVGLLLGLGIVFGVAYKILQSGLFFYFLGKSEVELSIVAPDSVIAGDRVVYSVVYKNNSKNAVTSGELSLEYPKGTQPIDEVGESTAEGRFRVKVPIPALVPGEEQHADFPMRLFGKEGDVIVTTAMIVFTPENVASKFTVRKDFTTTISRVPIALAFSGGTKVKSGDQYEFRIEYASNSDTDFKNVALRVAYPDGFQYQESDKVPDVKDPKQMIWMLGDVHSGSSGSIRIQGIVTGVTLEPKSFQYSLGMYDKDANEWLPYIDQTAVAEIIEQPLGVMAYINNSREGVASFGDTLNGIVKIKNNSAVRLNDIQIQMTADGPVDFAKVHAMTGVVVGSRAIQWNSATDPALQSLNPGEERSLQFSVGLRSAESAGRFKNATVTLRTSIQAAQGATVDFNPTGSDTLMISLNAVPSFQSKALYSGSLIRNTGPIPPKVGQRTSYAIVWEIDSLGGDLSDVRMSAFLPPYIQWEDVIVPDSEKIAYQKSTGEIIWNPGVVRAGEGTRRVMFQISLTPSEAHFNMMPILVSKIKGSAVDAFTNKEIQVTVSDVTTNLLNDFGVPAGSGSVRK